MYTLGHYRRQCEVLLLSLLSFGLTVAEASTSNTTAVAGYGATPASILSLDGEWLLAVDPQNVGRNDRWWLAPRPESKSAQVPWIIQEAFPEYHGVAWYYRDFTAPTNPHPGGRYLLRFNQVDYLADVWLNGVSVGGHEGGETPFDLDVTGQIKPNQKNALAVRVLNPTTQPIDGIVMNETARRCKVMPFRAGAGFNHGGITGSVELICTPAVYVTDLFVTAVPEQKTGRMHIQASVRNASKPAKGHVDITVASARTGETSAVLHLQRDFAPGDTLVNADLTIDAPHLWQLNDPYLYRVTARVAVDGQDSFHEQSTRCGFRDFRFTDGYFRLNGKRIYLRCSHTCNHYPIGQQFPRDPDLLRRDLLNMKVMGFNTIRFIWGGATQSQLDLCDEMGFLVYQESYASMWIDPSPRLAERFDSGVSELIRRDRNHPSIVIWGLLNEAPDCPAFHHGIKMLPLVRSLDTSRVVMLNSGRYDNTGSAVGSLSNPGSNVWEDVISDRHLYPRVPHTREIIQSLRQMNGPAGQSVFLSEYGIGSAVDLWRAVRHFEQNGAAELEDTRFFRDKLNRFLVDWKQWRLDEVFGRPEDFFAESLKKMAGNRTLGLNAIRSNPNIISHSLTGATDHVMCGEGLTTLFRELKPGTIDAMFDAWAPLRWCLFAEPPHIAAGQKVHLEAVLANEDTLTPGEYPALVQVIGPQLNHVLDRTITVKILPPESKREQPFAQQYLAEDVVVNGPPGKYRFVVSFQKGAAAAGGETDFYVSAPADMPNVPAEVVLWGDDPGLKQWLTEHNIRARDFAPTAPAQREVILATGKPAAPGGAAAFAELSRRIATGSTVVFLSPEVFAKPNQPTAWLPLANKGTLSAPVYLGLYLKDEWARQHPILDGLQTGGLMDYTYYREILPDLVWSGQDPPAEAVAGAIKASQDYASGLMVGIYRLGSGRFVLNTLRIRETLTTHPVAERLLRNMLLYAAQDLAKPPTKLPDGFDLQLKAMGYE